jgi:hypothetical protein
VKLDETFHDHEAAASLRRCRPIASGADAKLVHRLCDASGLRHVVGFFWSDLCPMFVNLFALVVLVVIASSGCGSGEGPLAAVAAGIRALLRAPPSPRCGIVSPHRAAAVALTPESRGAETQALHIRAAAPNAHDRSWCVGRPAAAAENGAAITYRWIAPIDLGPRLAHEPT